MAAVAASTAGLAGPAGAVGRRDGAGGVRLGVEAGIGGFVAPGRPYPVTITVSTDRLIAGAVRVEILDSMAIERAVEVAGGATARFMLLAPPIPLGPGGQTEVRARLSGSGVTAEGGDTVEVDLDQELVGVLPEAAGPAGSLPGTVPLAVDAGVARLVPVEPGLLDAGPLALEPLDQIVASTGELASLDPGARRSLLSWVDGGGHLVLGAGDASVEALPAEWRPQPGWAQRAGLGQVRLAGGDWQRSLAPSPTRSTLEEGIMASSLGNFVTEPMVASLADDTGLSLPGGDRLGLLVAGYVLLMGPAVYLVVRRLRRRELAWVGLPVLALASTGLVFAIGSALRADAQQAHVSVFEVGPGAAVATTWSLVPGPPGGDVGLDLPPGWTGWRAREAAGMGLGLGPQGIPVDPWAGSGVRLAIDGDETRLEQHVGPGGFALLESRGPAPGMAGALAVTATSTQDGEIRGTVRNGSDVTLHAVAGFTGRARAVAIGSLAPGESRDFRIDDATRYEWDARPETAVWPSADRPFAAPVPEPLITGDDARVTEPLIAEDDARVPGPLIAEDGGAGAEDGNVAGDEPPVVLAAWSESLQRTGTNYRPTGQVVVAGWTDELPPPVTAGHGRGGRTTSAVVARATPVAAGARLTDTASVTSIVRGPVTQPPVDTPEVAAANGIGFIRSIDLPGRVADRQIDLDRLVINPSALLIAFDFWTPSGWVPVEPPATGHAEVPVPPEAVIDGVVYVRITAPTDRPPPSGRDLVVYEREGT